jgi:hypothetical protein
MAVKERERNDVTFEIVEQLGVISVYPTGWSKQLNLVIWNGGTAKYDLRDWAPDGEHMSKGVTMHKDEAMKLFELLKDEFKKKK